MCGKWDCVQRVRGREVGMEIGMIGNKAGGRGRAERECKSYRALQTIVITLDFTLRDLSAKLDLSREMT